MTDSKTPTDEAPKATPEQKWKRIAIAAILAAATSVGIQLGILDPVECECECAEVVIETTPPEGFDATPPGEVPDKEAKAPGPPEDGSVLPTVTVGDEAPEGTEAGPKE